MHILTVTKIFKSYSKHVIKAYFWYFNIHSDTEFFIINRDEAPIVCNID